MNRGPTEGIGRKAWILRYWIHQQWGEMKIQGKLGTAASVLLILLLAFGAQAGTVAFENTDLQRGTDISPTNLLGVAGVDWDLGLFRFWDLDRSRGKVSDEPLPAAAVLILVGLVALIALKGRRK